MTLEDLLISGADAFGITLPDSAPRKFRLYYDILTERAGEFNLTAITGEEQTAKLHFLDSLALLRFQNFKGKTVADIGCGAGFPGFPILIAEPDATLTAVDSSMKKIHFLEETAALLDIAPECVSGRAEELTRTAEHRDRYDIAVSRAVAELRVLLEYALPFVKEGGTFIAMKSVHSDEEIAAAGNALRELHGEIESVGEYVIPDTDIKRRAIIIRKTDATPDRYPRRAARIQSKPL